MAYKCCDGDPQRTDNHPVYAVNLTVCRPGGNGIRSQSVNTALDDDIGQGIHYRLQAGRQPDFNYSFDHEKIQTDLADNQLIGIRRPHQGKHHEYGADKLGKYRCNSRAPDFHPENHNQYDIQHNIGQAACHQKVKRALGIPDRSQNPGTHIINQVRDDSDKINI